MVGKKMIDGGIQTGDFLFLPSLELNHFLTYCDKLQKVQNPKSIFVGLDLKLDMNSALS